MSYVVSTKANPKLGVRIDLTLLHFLPQLKGCFAKLMQYI